MLALTTTLAPPQADLGFGLILAASGPWLAVKSLRTDDDPPVEGPVHLYERTAGGWAYRQSIVLPGGAQSFFTSHSLALGSELLVIGAPYDGEGGLLAGATLWIVGRQRPADT